MITKTQRNIFRSLALTFAITPISGTAQTDGVWEPLGAHYQNLRGTNYIASYRSLTSAATRPPGYVDVASSTAMWKFSAGALQDAEIDAQLNWIRGLGLNTVRVWLSYPLWYADRHSTSGNRMVDAFARFLVKCEARRLYVMPVLWDAHCYGATPCLEPDYDDPAADLPPYRNVSHWAPTPGQTVLAQFAAQGYAAKTFRSYIRDMVQAGRNSSALVMWDIMNEPAPQPGDANFHASFLAASLAEVRRHDPVTPTTIGFTGVIENSPAAFVVRDPNLDVISIHTYGTFRENVEEYVRDAATLVDGLGGELDKPILVTEIGQPGWGQSYAATLNYVEEVEYGPFSDPSAHVGTGFYLFSAMCGWNLGNFPHRDAHGIFFTDGEVRDIEACIAIQAIAVRQGVDPRTLTPSFVQKSELDGDFFAQGPLIDGHDYDESIRRLALPSWYYSILSMREGIDFANMFRILGYDIAVVNAGPTPPLALDPDFYRMQLLFSEIILTGQIPGRTLTQGELNLILDMWRYSLLPYVAQLRGPSPGE